MTDPTPPHRRSPMEHERDACPYCAEGALTIAHFQGVASERARTQARIEALEAERDRYRVALMQIVGGTIYVPHDGFRQPHESEPSRIARAALKGEGE